jgi:SAM-dependent methyltransferase
MSGKRVISDVFKVEDVDGAAVRGASRRPWGAWAGKHGLLKKELLLPQIEIECATTPAPWMREPTDLSRDQLKTMVEETGPWSVPFHLGQGVWTLNKAPNIEAMTFRGHLIGGGIQKILGQDLAQATVLDMATRNGYFAFEFAHRGCRQIFGFDLRSDNITQAEWLKKFYDMKNISFGVSNVYDVDDTQYDLVLNLGLLYHVNDPLKLMQMTYDRCRKCAVINTVARFEPFPGFVFISDLDVNRRATGEFSCELHPTYRAVIALMQQVGFKDLTELVGHSERPHPAYVSGQVRCIVGFK